MTTTRLSQKKSIKPSIQNKEHAIGIVVGARRAVSAPENWVRRKHDKRLKYSLRFSRPPLSCISKPAPVNWTFPQLFHKFEDRLVGLSIPVFMEFVGCVPKAILVCVQDTFDEEKGREYKVRKTHRSYNKGNSINRYLILKFFQEQGCQLVGPIKEYLADISNRLSCEILSSKLDKMAVSRIACISDGIVPRIHGRIHHHREACQHCA